MLFSYSWLCIGKRLRLLKKTEEFKDLRTNSVDTAEAAHDEPPHLDLHC